MAGALRKTMVYLGLAEEDEGYDDYDANDRHDDGRREHGRRDTHDDESRVERVERVERPAVRVREIEPEEPSIVSPRRRERAGSHVASVPSPSDEVTPARRAEVTPLPRRTPVAEVVDDVEVTGVNRITTIHPRTYNEAKNIGESFREGTPVIMNLSDLDDADAKRLVDFAAGLVFGLQGSIERVTSKVFLLSPADVEVTSQSADGAAKSGRGLFNQS